ncbi:MAG TPA: TIGR02680 family protein, partial [Gammaproteobacteria bacterium]|nr:TIGR02680 family protein [Gammaproteobacteria bacterium]
MRKRWQPLRLGLVELYHYDVEEFAFRDGHLLLRGNNGTGKSKVLSLTLPFLLDADLRSSRVEPDGDRHKRMDWNLLMGHRHDRRTGYAWMELGRRDESGAAVTLTLGAGLRAVAGRGSVDAWFFVTDQRIGRDLSLVTAERTAISHERLVEAIGARGQVFRTARDYRRAVDERLFGLGAERYGALVDTLIQLRQPQLSKQPNEERLSDALTEALAPLDRASLESVAEAMGQLEELKRELAELDAMREAVASFGNRYRRYAQIAARRKARTVRQAQTEWDNASRDLHAAERALEKA